MHVFIRHYALADIFIHLILYLLAGVHPIIAVKMRRTALTLLVVFIARCKADLHTCPSQTIWSYEIITN